MAAVVTKVYHDDGPGINQCDIFKDVEYIEYVKEEGNIIEVSKIVFPQVIVLTQACDLQQDYNDRKKNEEGSAYQDKYLISVIVAPLYNFEDFRQGTHLNQLGLMMQPQGGRAKSKCDAIFKNENKRYHYLAFPEDVDLVESVIDFKHYFTVTMNYLQKNREEKYIYSISILYRELILQRFSNFLSRIGLPDSDDVK